ncbi:MAG: YbhB/YbcL family Raf kinase inhibitor-like protein [Actinobacteria bacterium]|nr:YbhB/YbcL family Raf kinase inhibitor-like protein [Actinomycetota bacterium]
MTDFCLVAATFSQDGPMPELHGHQDAGGSNLSPALEWRGAPSETQSFAVTMFDLDEPTGVGFVHWSLFNIPVNRTALPEGFTPGVWPDASIEAGFTDWGNCRYGGPAPTPGSGPHRYLFTVYALDLVALHVEGQVTTYAMLQYLMRDHVIATACLTGTYEVGS